PRFLHHQRRFRDSADRADEGVSFDLRHPRGGLGRCQGDGRIFTTCPYHDRKLSADRAVTEEANLETEPPALVSVAVTQGFSSYQPLLAADHVCEQRLPSRIAGLPGHICRANLVLLRGITGSIQNPPGEGSIR